MYKIKKFTIILLTIIMLLVSTATTLANSSDIRFLSNQFTQLEQVDAGLINYNNLIDGFEEVATTDYLTLYVDTESLAIKVRNQLTGYIWSSTLDQMEDYQLNETWRNFINSAVTIDFVVPGENPSRESLTTNNSQTNVELIENGFQADIQFSASGVELQLVVTLEGSDVVVQVLDETVYEPEDIHLIAIQLYPFLGATKEDHVPGYIFIPDGAGALIRFDEQEVAMDAPFRGMIYGNDLGLETMENSLLNEPHAVRMPVYGMVHGVKKNALLTIVENGDNYAEIIAHTAGLSTEFNWITTMFHYRQTYNQPTTRDKARGSLIQVLQAQRNNFDIVMRHRILSEDQADYVGMALSYQQRLVDQGVLVPIEQPAPMMRLEFIGAETQEGLLWNTIIAMTPVTDIPDHVERLQEQGLNDLLVVYRGWARGGISNSFPKRARFETNLGSKEDIGDVINALSESEIPLYFHTDYTRVDQGLNNLFGGPRLAQGITTRAIPNNFLVPVDALEQASNDMNNFAYYGIDNLAIETTTSHVYSTWGQEFTGTRSENETHVQELLDVLNEGKTSRTILYEPNAPFWRATSHYFDIPMTTSGYLFATDTVPFLHIVLRGHINYYAPVSNFSANSRQELLRAIDFGTYPSFLLTSEPSHLLAETPSRVIFTSEFEVWNETIVEYYEIISEALGQVRGVPIASREVLAPGIVRVTYANDVRIIVNYTQRVFRDNGVTIEAENFLVMGGR